MTDTFKTHALLVDEKLICGREVVFPMAGTLQCVEEHVHSEKGYVKRLCWLKFRTGLLKYQVIHCQISSG